MKYNNHSQSNQLINLLTNFKQYVEIVDEQGFEGKKRVDDKFLNDLDRILGTSLLKKEKEGAWSFKAFFYEILTDETKTFYDKCVLVVNALMPDLLDKSTGNHLLSDIKCTLQENHDDVESEKLLESTEQVNKKVPSESLIVRANDNFSNLSEKGKFKKQNNLTLFDSFKKEIISTYNNKPKSKITEARFKGTKLNKEEKKALVSAAHEKDFFDVGKETLLDEKYYKQELPSKGNKAEQLDRALADMLQEMEYNESIKNPSSGK